MITLQFPTNSSHIGGLAFGPSITLGLPIDQAVAAIHNCARELSRSAEKAPGRTERVRQKTKVCTRALPSQQEYKEQVERERARYRPLQPRPHTKSD